MATEPQHRKLATIVALDVAGYSARTEADEEGTTAEVAALGAFIEGVAARRGGRVFNTAGDGFMLEFGSSLAAVEAGIELAEQCEPKVRVGIHLGDVVVQPTGDLLGHGVNVAARLMARSEPGSLLVSADVRRTIRGPIAERLVSRGAQMKVVGRTSSFQFRDADKNVRNVAKELHCSHVLDGSIRRAGGRVRITAHLVEASSQTTLWSDRFDGGLDDVFAVQDEISEQIATALDQTFTSFSTKAIDPEVYDLYLRASPTSYAPDELRASVELLERATERAPAFAEAWGRLAFVRAWLRLYEPFADRASSAARIVDAAERALSLDAQNVDALLARCLIGAPFGRFAELYADVERFARAPGVGAQAIYVGWNLRAIGLLRESAAATERAFALDALSPMVANLTALSRMATGRVADAVPIFEELMARVPDMSFPVANLMRAQAFLGNWAQVDRLLDPAAGHPLREFEDGLAFIRAKRDPSPENLAAIRKAMQARYERTGGVEASQLVYAAHLGLVDEVYSIAEEACLGPRGTDDDVMGPDGYRTGLLFHAGMPELRNDPRFVTLCARFGLVQFWLESGKWPDCADEVPYDFKAECERARSIPVDEIEV